MLRQAWLPGFPEGAQKVGEALAVLERDEQVTYFVGGDTYFTPPVGDDASRRFALSSLMENGHVRAIDLEKAPLLIPHRTLMNWVGQSRKQGPSSFFRPVPPTKPRIMTVEKSAECARTACGRSRPTGGDQSIHAPPSSRSPGPAAVGAVTARPGGAGHGEHQE